MTSAILSRPTTRARLLGLAEGQFGDLVKPVVDVERGVMAIGGELSDEEAALIEDGSVQKHLWGIDLYPAGGGGGWGDRVGCADQRSPDSVLRDRIRQIVTGLVEG